MKCNWVAQQIEKEIYWKTNLRWRSGCFIYSFYSWLNFTLTFNQISLLDKRNSRIYNVLICSFTWTGYYFLYKYVNYCIDAFTLIDAWHASGFPCHFDITKNSIKSWTLELGIHFNGKYWFSAFPIFWKLIKLPFISSISKTSTSIHVHTAISNRTGNL